MAKISTDYGAQALDLNQLIDLHGGTGIVSGCGASVGTNAMEVDVASGAARVNGTNYSITASTVLLDSANSDYPRKDLVVVDNTGSVTKITGTAEEAKPAGSTRRNTRRPRPSDISGSDVAVIAEVWVGAGASDIVSGDISDRRLIPLVEGFLDVDGDDVAELQDNHADFQGGDARNVGALDADGLSSSEAVIGSDQVDYSVFVTDAGDYKAIGPGGFESISSTDVGAVIDAAFTDGGDGTVVEVAPGSYQMETQATIPSNGHLKGAGRRTCIIRFDSNPGLAPAFFLKDGQSSAEHTVEGFDFEESGGATVEVFHVEGTTQTIRNCWFGPVSQAVVVNGAAGFDLTDLHSDGVSGFDIQITGPARNGYIRNVNTFQGKRGFSIDNSAGSGIPQDITFVGCATEYHNGPGMNIVHARDIHIIGHFAHGNDAAGISVRSGAHEIEIANPLLLENGQDTGLTAPDRSGVRIEGTNVKVRGGVFDDRQGTKTQQHAVYYGANSVDADVINPVILNQASSDVGTDGTETRPRWNGVIGGGSLGGVDLSTTSGQFVGDQAMSNGTNTTAYLLAQYTGTAWQPSDGGATI